MSFLDLAGLTRFKQKLDVLFSGKLDTSLKGAVNGLAELDSAGKVPTSQLPSYVDDVVEVNSYSDLPATGETGKIYVTKDTNISYRWGGSAYVKISDPNIMTGATSSAAGTSGLTPIPAAGDQDKYLKGDGTWSEVDALPTVTSSDNDKVLQVANGEWGVGTKKLDKDYEVADFSLFDFGTGAPSNFDGRNVWSDGENVYYSDGSYQYVLNKETLTWSTKTWAGLDSFLGSFIWTDGDNIYYSNGYQKILDKSTSTWNDKTWTGLNFYGDDIWSDGENVYYSTGATQYVLDRSSSTWSAKIWTGLTNFSGKHVWSDGDNIYYSNGSLLYYQYVLNRSTSTWSAKTWTGAEKLYGNCIWFDGDNIYHSFGSYQYALDKQTSTWSTKAWTGLTNYYGYYIWTDGNNIYYSNSDTYKYEDSSKPKIYLGTNNEFNIASLSDLTMSGATASTAGSLGFVPAPSAGDENKVLAGDGTWHVMPYTETLDIDLDTVTNTSGSYSGTTIDSRVTADMKVLHVELGNRNAFNDDITITCDTGTVTLACNDVSGTSTVRITVMRTLNGLTNISGVSF